MKYAFRDGAHIAKIDAQTAGETLEALRAENNGRLTADIVVEASTPKDAPLHPAFEWNDRKAAHEFRKDQARNIVRSVVVFPDGNENNAAEHVYTHVVVATASDKVSAYMHVSDVLADPELRAQRERTALRELQAYRRKHESIMKQSEPFRKVALAIDDLFETIDADALTAQQTQHTEGRHASNENESANGIDRRYANGRTRTHHHPAT